MWQGKREKPREKLTLDSVSSTTKPTWSDRDANSRSQQWEASVYPLVQRSHLHLFYVIISYKLAKKTEKG